MPVLNFDLLTRETRASLGMDLRSDVLFFTPYFEELTAMTIPAMLRIDQENSILFGHTSRALTFDQRIQFLIELGSLDEQHKSQFLWLLQIRNQLMHNRKAISMTACLKYTTVKEKDLLKAFGNDESMSKEEQLVDALQRLCYYVMSASTEILIDAANRLITRMPRKYQKGLPDFQILKEEFKKSTKSWKKGMKGKDFKK